MNGSKCESNTSEQRLGRIASDRMVWWSLAPSCLRQWGLPGRVVYRFTPSFHTVAAWPGWVVRR
jgi:hypothetical protein